MHKKKSNLTHTPPAGPSHLHTTPRKTLFDSVSAPLIVSLLPITYISHIYHIYITYIFFEYITERKAIGKKTITSECEARFHTAGNCRNATAAATMSSVAADVLERTVSRPS